MQEPETPDPGTPHNEPQRPPAENAAIAWQEGDIPFSPLFGDHFFCRTDGRLECGHVFLAGNDLPERWQQADTIFRIGELGFGTGLNFCETWRQWKACRGPGRTLHFLSFELHPMAAKDIDRVLRRWPQLDAERQALAALWPPVPRGRLDLTLDCATRLTVFCGPAFAGVNTMAETIDAWYLDGFAPARNPDMWSSRIIAAIFDKTVCGGSFATYAAAGFVRRNLAAAGFSVERRKGFAAKREMLCGRKPA